MHAVIILNAPLPHDRYLKPVVAQATKVICADGGTNRALERGIEPDVIIGDLDSIASEWRQKVAADRIVHKPSQYATDLEKALQYAVDAGFASATLLGVSGERFDHQICNLTMMEKFCRCIDLDFIDDWGQGRIIFDTFSFSGEIGQMVSLHAMRKAEGVLTDGLKYPLNHEDLEWAVRDGQSNQIVSNPVTISIAKGNVFMFVTHGTL